MAVRLTEISVLLNNFNVKKNLRMMSKAAVDENRLGGEFYKGGEEKCR